MTTTVYFTIGNSDDKLPQARWSKFVAAVHLVVDRETRRGATVEFAGYSAPAAAWQNALWCVTVPDLPSLDRLRSSLRELAARYGQDSIAWAEVGVVQLLTPITCGCPTGDPT